MANSNDEASRSSFRNKDAETIQRLQTENKVLKEMYGKRKKKKKEVSGSKIAGLAQLGSSPSLPTGAARKA